VRRLTLASLLCAVAAQAQTTSPEADARQRFELATRLYAQGNKEQSLEEFKRVAAVIERPAVFLNLVVLNAELGHPEAAVEAADKLLANPGSLDEARLTRVRTLREEQQKKLGQVKVSAPVDGIEVSLGGRLIGPTPLSRPVFATSGRVILSAKAPRYEPVYRELVVPAGGTLDVALEIKPVASNLATVRLRSQTPGADIFIDGLLAGVTPEVVKLAVMPGSRTISLRRLGYRSAEKTVTIPEGGEVEVELDPSPDEGAEQGELAVTSSEEQVSVSVDGQRKGLLTANAVKLPPGPHVVRFERGGFFPIRRELSLQPLERQSLRLVFEPTPELRGELLSTASWHRLLGWIGVGVGAAGLAASAAYTFGYLANETRQLNAESADIERQATSKTGCFSNPDPNAPSCEGLSSVVQRRRAQVDTFFALGITGVAVSAALLAAGVVSLVTTPDLAKYDRPIENFDFIQRLSIVPTPQGGFVLASGAF
jgi:hypothetical protein